MGEVLITRKSQRGGVPPDGFTQPTQILTESGTWTCPRSGTYRVTCIGSGGLASCTPDVNMISGGGGGGIAESQLKLIKDSAITITVDSAISSFGNYLSASAGGTGFSSNFCENAGAGAGAGGSASGGNIGNYTGGAGAVASSYSGGNLLGDGDGVKVIKCGGDTSKESKYGGAIGAMASRYPSVSCIAYGFINPITNGHPCFGAGQAIYGKHAVAGNNMGSGAIIIEYLK